MSYWPKIRLEVKGTSLPASLGQEQRPLQTEQSLPVFQCKYSLGRFDSGNSTIRMAQLHDNAIGKLRKAFHEVDKDGSHKIDWREIQDCCASLNITLDNTDYYAFRICDKSKDGSLNFKEFCEFVEMRLLKVFQSIDIDQNGSLDAYEIQKCLEKLSKPLSIRKVKAIIAGMDKDGDGTIDFGEFSDFFADMPTASLALVAEKWISGFGIDIGSDQVPSSIPPAEVPLWRFMLAGGCGGVASRTATAPIEKIKILAQVF